MGFLVFIYLEYIFLKFCLYFTPYVYLFLFFIFFYFYFFYFYFLVFLVLPLQYMEAPRLGVESEL